MKGTLPICPRPHGCAHMLGPEAEWISSRMGQGCQAWAIPAVPWLPAFLAESPVSGPSVLIRPGTPGLSGPALPVGPGSDSTLSLFLLLFSSPVGMGWAACPTPLASAPGRLSIRTACGNRWSYVRPLALPSTGQP